MARPAPTIQAPAWQEPSLQDTLTLHLRLITPLFGGGYEAREVDPVCIIRPATIRGHLRFWWRALYGARYPSSQEMFKAESQLWGAASDAKNDLAGKVSLRVEQVRWDKSKVTVDDFKPQGRLAKVGPQAQYLLYVFQRQQTQNIPPATGYLGVQFVLNVSFHPSATPEQRQEVQNSLRAWIALGGIGARTRRGCGVLTVTQEQKKWLPPADPSARQQWFRQLLPDTGTDAPPRLTLLKGARIICAQPVGENQWKNVLHDLGSFWARFRKGHVGAGQTYTPMAGSKWQDYRGALLQFNPKGGNTISLCKPYLGLPIVYQAFKNAPYTPTIESEQTGRMASPVILKPMALADGRICATCVVLRAPQPRAVQLKPPGVQVSLQVRKDDQVLRALGVSHPLAGVIVAAEQQWNTRAFTV